METSSRTADNFKTPAQIDLRKDDQGLKAIADKTERISVLFDGNTDAPACSAADHETVDSRATRKHLKRMGIDYTDYFYDTIGIERGRFAQEGQ